LRSKKLSNPSERSPRADDNLYWPRSIDPHRATAQPQRVAPFGWAPRGCSPEDQARLDDWYTWPSLRCSKSTSKRKRPRSVNGTRGASGRSGPSATFIAWLTQARSRCEIALRREQHEKIGSAVAFVLVIMTGRAARFRARKRGSRQLVVLSSRRGKPAAAQDRAVAYRPPIRLPSRPRRRCWPLVGSPTVAGDGV
jgi:hypothetical protein